MTQAISIFGLLFGAISLLIYSYRRTLVIRAVRRRTFAAEEQDLALDDEVVSVLKRYRWIPWFGGFVAGLLVFWFLSFPSVIAATIAVMVGLLGSQLESFLHDRRIANFQVQLADAIDLMVGALGAGAGAMVSLAAAIEESPQPLRAVLEEVMARIRLGDDPRIVFGNLALAVPDETFLLFSSTMAVHWEVGGSLAPTLAMLGRTIRDRIEMSRRIRSNVIQSQASTVLMVIVTYFIALLMWNHDPGSVEAFIDSTIGLWLVAISMLLQAAGVAWMAVMSKMKF
jgi:tight adherence protein B